MNKLHTDIIKHVVAHVDTHGNHLRSEDVSEQLPLPNAKRLSSIHVLKVFYSYPCEKGMDFVDIYTWMDKYVHQDERLPKPDLSSVAPDLVESAQKDWVRSIPGLIAEMNNGRDLEKLKKHFKTAATNHNIDWQMLTSKIALKNRDERDKGRDEVRDLATAIGTTVAKEVVQLLIEQDKKPKN